MTTIKDPKKYAYIDTLRGLAILGVMMVHCGQCGSNKYPQWVESIITSGSYGVQLFFIVSALTLFMSMKERSVNEKYPVLNFFIRRFFRIAPLFYIAIVYYLLEYAHGRTDVFAGSYGLSMFKILSTVTFTNGISPYWITSVVDGGWTIAVEMTFYLFLPLLFMTIKNLKTALLLTTIALLGSQLLDFILHKHVLISDAHLWESYLYTYFPAQLPTFLLGIVLFYLIKNKQKAVPAEKDQGISFAMVWLIIAVLLMAQLVLRHTIPFYFLISVIFLILIYSLALSPIKLFVNKFTVFIGKISFSLYITHFAVVDYMDRFHCVDFLSNSILNFVVRYLVLLAAAGIVSFITYSLIEQPGQDIGKRLIKILNK